MDTGIELNIYKNNNDVTSNNDNVTRESENLEEGRRSTLSRYSQQERPSLINQFKNREKNLIDSDDEI
jgi:hypothetical protein